MNKILHYFRLTGTDLRKSIKDIPILLERNIPLKTTGISSRVFFHWRKQGLIDYPESDGIQREWIKLNFYEYTLLCFYEIIRKFGMPLRGLRIAKENLLMNFMSVPKEELSKYIELYNTYSNQSTEIKDLRKEIFQGFNYQDFDLPNEYKITTTFWATCIHDILFSGDDISIAVLCYSVKGEKEFDFVPFSRQKFFEMPQLFSEVLQYPHIHVPLNPIVKEFLGNSENLDSLISMQFLTSDEIKVIKAIRTGRLKELIIHFSEGKSPMRIEAVESGHVSKDVLSRLIRILGTKNYKEFSLKVRNDKTLYYENKIKIL